MRILCVCEYGNVRSVALAYLLKTIFKHEVIAVGVKNVSFSTLEMLSYWADLIIPVSKEIYRKIPAPYLEKGILFNIGKDIWRDARHQGLIHELYKQINKHLKELI